MELKSRLPIFLSIILTLVGSVPAYQTPAHADTASRTVSSSSQKPQMLSENPEKFDSLSLEGSGLKPEIPLSAGVEEKAKFTREIVQLKWRPGDIIEVYVIKPKGVQNPPVILYLYGYPADNQRFEMDSYAERITDKGFAAIGFVAALDGPRYKNRPMKEWFVSELQESLVTSAHDVQLILNYLEQRGDLDIDHVGMFGEGSGGTIAVLAAATDKRIKAVDLLDPWGDWPDWMAKSAVVPEEEREALTQSNFLSKLKPYDILRYLPLVKPKPLRVVQTKDDPNTPIEAKKKIEIALPATSTSMMLESGQDLGGIFAGGKTFFDWIKEQVKTETAGPATSRAPASAAAH